jgi:excisionase family DNA binding protein
MNSDERVEQCRLQLERAVLEAGHVLSGDNRVSESTAARLLGISQSHLRRLRHHGELVAYKCGLNGARVSYRLVEIASFIEATRDSE